MQDLSIDLPAEVLDALEREASRSGKSISIVICDALVAHLPGAATIDPSRRFGIVGIGNSGQTGIASRVDEILEEEWGDPDFGRGG